MRKNSSNTHSFFSLCTVLLVFFITSILSVSVYLVQSVTIATISVVPLTVTASIGENFSINVNISNVLDLYGWEFRLSWNATLLDAVSAVEGPFLKAKGQTFFTYKINNTVGYVLVDCTLLGIVPGVSGNGTLATVGFYVKGRGESILDLHNTTLLNSLEQPIIHVAVDGNGVFTPSHDIAVIDVIASPTMVLPGQSVQINATVENQGAYAEDFNVTVYYDSVVIETVSVVLDQGELRVLTFTWDTTGVNKGDYLILAKASVVSGETDITNNAKVADSMVTVLVPGHDVAIKDVTPCKTVVGQGYSLFVYVSTKNYGVFTETFNVTAYYNETAITLPDGKNYTTITLTSGNSTISTFTWSTVNVSKGNYTIKAEATLSGDTNTTDNHLTNGWVTVAMVGDIIGPDGWPDGKCDMRDVAMVAKLFGVNHPDPRYDPNCDIIYDLKIDMKDVGTVAKHFGETDP